MNAKRKLPKRTKWLIVLAVVILILVVIRIALPIVALRNANQKLTSNKNYYGQIKDINLSFLRGSFHVDSVYLNKVDSLTSKQTPMFSALSITLSVEWKALMHGAFVGTVIIENPSLTFTKDKVEPAELLKDSIFFRKVLKVMPIEINRFEVNEGIIQYKDERYNPPVGIELNNIHILAQNLRNSYDSSCLLPADINASALFEDGTFDFKMKLDPMALIPTFKMNAELKNVNLVKLNDFFQAYAQVDVNEGTFSLYAEGVAKDRKFVGRVEPVIKDLDMLGREDKNENWGHKLWEGLVGTIVKNRTDDKIDMEARVELPQTSVPYAIINILRMAFVQGLQPSIRSSISTENPKIKKDTLKKEGSKKKKRKKE